MNTAAPRVAVIQMVSTESLEANLRSAARLLRRAAKGGAVLAVLPENFALFGGRAAVDWLLAQPPGEHAINAWLARTARDTGLWIVAGSVPWLPDVMRPSQATPTRVYSASQVFSPQGECVARYCKIHLFDVDVDDAHGSYRESDDFMAGNDIVVADTPVGRLGLAICYDLRFPELFRSLLHRGAELLCLPSAFTRVTGEAHWAPLVRARAIENQCYVLAANQGGRHSETRETSGHSMIVSPWGEVLAECPHGEGVAMAVVDRQGIAGLRRQMPVASHRRPDLFGE